MPAAPLPLLIAAGPLEDLIYGIKLVSCGQTFTAGSRKAKTAASVEARATRISGSWVVVLTC